MEIFGADLHGIEGQSIRFRVVGERNATGVKMLGDVRKVISKGTIERCLSAVRAIEGFSHVGSDLRYLIDLSPVEISVRSPGIDLPLAITIMQATVAQSFESIQLEIQQLELKCESQSGRMDEDKRHAEREKILQRLRELQGNLNLARKYQNALKANNHSFLLIGKIDITTGGLESPRDGMLGLISAASRKKDMIAIVPEDAESHSALVANANSAFGMKAFKARNLEEVWNIITGLTPGRRCTKQNAVLELKSASDSNGIPDLKDIRGNGRAKLALETALAGRHSLLLIGPAGQGKSMLAKAATKLLPQLEAKELLEVNKIHSARGELRGNELIVQRPYQEVSSTVTQAALFGCAVFGGHVRPGLISAAHKGILFFDEVNLIDGKILDRLRAPWSDGMTTVQRGTSESVEFPARFQFIGAMNPCKCGWYYHMKCCICQAMIYPGQSCPHHPDANQLSACSCNQRDIDRYLGRLSGPISDRISMVCLVSQYDQDEPWHDKQASRTVNGRITRAWERQKNRYGRKEFQHIGSNSDVGHPQELLNCGAIDRHTERLLTSALKKDGLEFRSIRKINQLLAIARTVADLEDSESITEDHINKALQVSGIRQKLMNLD